MEYLQIGLALLGVGQLIARAVKTPKSKDIENRLGRWINIILSATREK